MGRWGRRGGAAALCLLLAGTAAVAEEIDSKESAKTYREVFDRSGVRDLAEAETDESETPSIRLSLARYRPEIPPPGPSKWSQGFFVLGAAADLYTTKRVLDDPRGVEANPLLAVAGDDFTVLASAAGFKIATYFAVRKLSRRGYISRRQANRFLGAFGGIQLGAAYYNREQYHRAKD